MAVSASHSIISSRFASGDLKFCFFPNANRSFQSQWLYQNLRIVARFLMTVKKKKIDLFVVLSYWVCDAAQAFSGCGGWELLFSCGAWVSHCGGFSCCGALSLGCLGFRSCSTWTQQLRLLEPRGQAQQVWRAGLVAPEHVESSTNGDQTLSPALAGGLPTTRPPGKPSDNVKISVAEI